MRLGRGVRHEQGFFDMGCIVMAGQNPLFAAGYFQTVSAGDEARTSTGNSPDTPADSGPPADGGRLMGRPTKDNVDYFPHDNCMRNDKKIKAVRARFGITGYAVYGMLLEALAEEDMLQIKYTETGLDILAGDFGVSVTEMREILEYLAKDEINLVQIEGEHIRCRQLDRRMYQVFKKRGTSLNELRGHLITEKKVSEAETGVSVTESTQSKVKKRKENIYIPFFDFWNAKESLIHHRRFTDSMQKVLQKRLQENDPEEIKACIDNYAAILSDPQRYWYTYRHTLENFFRNGDWKEPPFRKFLPEAEPLQNFCKERSAAETAQTTGGNGWIE